MTKFGMRVSEVCSFWKGGG